MSDELAYSTATASADPVKVGRGSAAIGMALHFGILMLPIVSLTLGNEAAKHQGHWLFIAQLLLFYGLLLRDPRSVYFFTPIMLAVQYVDFSFFLGGWAHSHELVVFQGDYRDFLAWKRADWSTTYILLANTALFHLDLRFHSRYRSVVEHPLGRVSPHLACILLAVSVGAFAIFSVVALDVAFLGGSGEMSSVPKTIAALVIIYLVAKSASKWRFLAYAAILVVFSAFSFSSKREAIFLVTPMFLLESVLNIRRFRLWMLLPVGMTTVFLMALILVMTLMRGHGGYIERGGGLLSALPFILAYASTEDFLPHFLLNIETTYTYFHSMQAMEYVHMDSGLISFGSTLAKFLFITLPSSVIDFKPDSLTHIYTTMRSPAFRAAGGSWPPNVYAEMFWNFHFAGLAGLLAIAYPACVLFARLCSWIRSAAVLKHVWGLYAYMLWLFLVRGSGLDLYLVYILFGFFFSMVFVSVFQLLSAASAKLRGGVNAH